MLFYVFVTAECAHPNILLLLSSFVNADQTPAQQHLQ